MDYLTKYHKYKTKYLELKSTLLAKSTKYDLEGGGKKKLKKSNSVQTQINKINKEIGGMELVPKYKETLSEPWFTLISLGLKTIEGRKNKGRFKEMALGDIVEWTNDDFKPRSVLTRITRKANYATFAEYLETEGLQRCLPGMPDLSHGLSVYYKYFTKEDEKQYGVVAIEIELVK
jgi:ASC-1-like (ASCH) protein